ncbi:MAG: hypothetical protein ACPG21_14230, partial [Crocinitomicaceae bacterium]
TDEQYEKDIAKYEKMVTDAKTKLKSVNAFDYYSIHFWTNIKTKDRLSVYYEIKLKLDPNYNILSAVENSSIGKKSEKSKIAYKKGSTGIKVQEK